jgi:hypothetical protein
MITQIYNIIFVIGLGLIAASFFVDILDVRSRNGVGTVTTAVMRTALFVIIMFALPVAAKIFLDLTVCYGFYPLTLCP